MYGSYWHETLRTGYLYHPDKDIKAFLKHYREEFPKSKYPKASILPKMHLLEDHMVGWLKKYHLGLGLMGEQGAESIHAHLNRLETTYSSVRNRLERLKHIFEMYTIETTPALQSLTPTVKRRKRKRVEDS